VGTNNLKKRRKDRKTELQNKARIGYRQQTRKLLLPNQGLKKTIVSEEHQPQNREQGKPMRDSG